MFVDWQSNKIKRIYTGVALVAALAFAFVLRLLTVWVFDAIMLVVIGIAVYEVMLVRKSDKRGASIYYVMFCIAVSYAMFILGFLKSFPVWLHAVVQLSVFAIFAVYTLLMNYADKEVAKESRLKKLVDKKGNPVLDQNGKQKNVTVGSLATRAMWEFLFIILYPYLLLFAFIPLNHIAAFATVGTGDEMKNVGMFAFLGLLLVFAISWCTDTCAYVVGCTVKSPKLCPKISPKKTIGGAIGGLFGGVIGVLLVLICVVQNKTNLQTYLTEQLGSSNQVLTWFIIMGFVGSVLTQVGDIFASWIKRRGDGSKTPDGKSFIGVKDFGKYLPGHGGAMDRLDGISFNVVFVTIVFYVIALF